jgi:hypothetical protein
LPVDRTGNVVVVDFGNHPIHLVACRRRRFAGATGPNARFNRPQGVVVTANGDIFVSDNDNHAIRIITL